MQISREELRDLISSVIEQGGFWGQNENGDEEYWEKEYREKAEEVLTIIETGFVLTPKEDQSELQTIIDENKEHDDDDFGPRFVIDDNFK